MFEAPEASKGEMRGQVTELIIGLLSWLNPEELLRHLHQEHGMVLMQLDSDSEMKDTIPALGTLRHYFREIKYTL